MPPIERFRELVFGNRELQRMLDGVSDDREFAALASQQAREHGFELSAEDVLDALRRARQSWLIRAL